MSVGAVAAGVGAVATVYSASQAGEAGSAQINAANSANAVSQRQYDQTRADYMPFIQSGTAANYRLAQMLGVAGNGSNRSLIDITNDLVKNYGLDPNDPKTAATAQAAFNAQYQGGSGELLKSFDANDLANDPIYKATFDTAIRTGTQQLNRLAAANGTLNSGAQAKALARFGADTQSTYANDAYNRYNTNQGNIYNRLAGLSGAGQQAIGTVASAGQQNASTIGNNLVGAGNARGASSIASGNVLSSGLGGAINSYSTNNLLSRLGSGTTNVYGSTLGSDLSTPAVGFRTSFV